MPIGSIVVLVLMAAAVVAILLVWGWGGRSTGAAEHGAVRSDGSAPPPLSEEVEGVQVPLVSQEGDEAIPDLSELMAPEVGRDSDPEITMMGKVPEEVLALLQGSLSADIPIEEEEEEEEFDIDVEELVDESQAEEPTGSHALILVVGVASSDRGRRRLSNEDAFLVIEEEHLFVVADGMGGHNAGEVASQKAVDVMESCFRSKDFPGESRPDWPRRGDELVRSIHHANHEVYALSQENPEYAGMGTTIVAVRFSPNKQRAYIAHVGDSRCYRIRGGELHQLTEDHTLGRLMGTKGKAAKHLAQAVGVRDDVAVDLTVDEPQPGDNYIVCSDGLTKMVPDDALLELSLADEDLEGRCAALIAEANERGGRDNITVIIIRVANPVKEARRVLEEDHGDAGT